MSTGWVSGISPSLVRVVLALSLLFTLKSLLLLFFFQQFHWVLSSSRISIKKECFRDIWRKKNCLFKLTTFTLYRISNWLSPGVWEAQSWIFEALFITPAVLSQTSSSHSLPRVSSSGSLLLPASRIRWTQNTNYLNKKFPFCRTYIIRIIEQYIYQTNIADLLWQ